MDTRSGQYLGYGAANRVPKRICFRVRSGARNHHVHFLERDRPSGPYTVRRSSQAFCGIAEVQEDEPAHGSVERARQLCSANVSLDEADVLMTFGGRA